MPEINNSGDGVDVNRALGNQNPYPREMEIAYRGGIKPENIISARKIDVITGKLMEEPIMNRNFKSTGLIKTCRK